MKQVIAGSYHFLPLINNFLMLIKMYYFIPVIYKKPNHSKTVPLHEMIIIMIF